MANANAAAVSAIKAAAQKYGLDPQAMIAVARVESGLRPDAIGDGGHAFGLFQFNNAGGVITGQANPERYLDPNFNAMEAARHMAKIPGLRGAKGKTAIELIVNKFERPADKGGEIAKALSFYKGMGAPAPTVGLNNGQIDSNVSQTAPNGLLANNGQTAQPINPNPLASLLQSAMSGSDPSQQENGSYDLLRMLTAPQEEVPAPTLPVISPTPGPPALVRTGSHQAQTMPGGGLVTSIKNPKIIGTPYQGTHTIGNWQSDNAVDIAMPVGTPIYAASDGVVGDRIGSLNSKSSRMAGLRLTLQGKDNSLYYAHLSKLAVKAGQRVKAGQLLGYSGSANGVAHLHLGAEKGNPGKYA